MTRPEQSKELGPSAPQTYGLSCWVSAQRAASAALPLPTIGTLIFARLPRLLDLARLRTSLNRLLSTLSTSRSILVRLVPISDRRSLTSAVRALALACARSAASIARATWASLLALLLLEGVVRGGLVEEGVGIGRLAEEHGGAQTPRHVGALREEAGLGAPGRQLGLADGEGLLGALGGALRLLELDAPAVVLLGERFDVGVQLLDLLGELREAGLRVGRGRDERGAEGQGGEGQSDERHPAGESTRGVFPIAGMSARVLPPTVTHALHQQAPLSAAYRVS
jgi:hypothetical protein